MVGVPKTSFVFDVIAKYNIPIDEEAVAKKIAELASAGVKEWWKDGNIPDILRPGRDMPAKAKLQVFFLRHNDSEVTILKHLFSAKL